MKISRNNKLYPIKKYLVSILILICLIISCFNKNNKIKICSRNSIYSKISYYNKFNKVDSIDFLYKDELYARYLLKDSQIYGYGNYSNQYFKSIDEAPIVNIVELVNSYKVYVRFEITSYVLWKFMVSKGSKMINFGSNVSLNMRSFEIPKESTQQNFMISNNEKEYFYKLN